MIACHYMNADTKLSLRTVKSSMSRKNAKCKNCKYGRNDDFYGAYICLRIVETCESRGCSVSKCNKFVKLDKPRTFGKKGGD